MQLKTDPSNVSLYIIERILSAIEDDQNQSIPRINVGAICHCMWTAGTHYAVFLRILSYLEGERFHIVGFFLIFLDFIPFSTTNIYI